MKDYLYRLVDRDNPIAQMKCRDMLVRLKAATSHPVVLVIGGGRIGNGAAALYEDAAVQVIGTDVYASPNTLLLADGHRLPFASDVFDGVWIQAVLEHVLEPQAVVNEIHRVLKPRGIVYADTPFMQQVHEGAYDFTRFTHSGHRWLFRRFDEIEAGVVAGAGEAMLWSLRYLAHAIGLGHSASRLVALPFVWVRFLERFMRVRANLDAANAIYFFGTKTDRTLSAKELGEYYKRYAGKQSGAGK